MKKTNRQPLFFKHKSPKKWSDSHFCLQLTLRKDGKTLDMRYKNTQEFVYQNMRTKFYDFMQSIANRLGCPHDETGSLGTMSWKNYLHPIKHIRYRLTGRWYL